MHIKDLIVTGNARVLGDLNASKLQTSGDIQAAGTIRTGAGEVSINGHTHSYLPLSGGKMTGTGQIKNSHTGGSWINARDNALIRRDTYTANSSYCPIYSCKISDGEISNGIIHPENRLVWAYTADANYPNNNASTTLMSLAVNASGGVLSALYSVSASSFAASSDERLKENIQSYSCDKSILDLEVKHFDFIKGPKNQVGCLAQDLQKICPELVQEGDDGYLAIQESKIVYLLLDEVKKLRAEVNMLKAKDSEEKY